MSKVINSNVDRWAGSVTFCDPLTAPQVFAIEDALDEIAEIEPSAFKRSQKKSRKKKGKVELKWQSRFNYAYLPAIILCVESWDLKNFPENVTRDTFPFIQSNDATILISNLFTELMKIYNEESTVPNE